MVYQGLPVESQLFIVMLWLYQLPQSWESDAGKGLVFLKIFFFFFKKRESEKVWQGTVGVQEGIVLSLVL